MAEVAKALSELDKGMANMKRGMGFVIEQVDQFEQNLQVDPALQPVPYPPPVHHPPPPLHEPELPGARV
eukprot:6839868-Prorocentrum_lima.AAC.1